MSILRSFHIEPIELPLRLSFATARDHLIRQVTRVVRVTLTTDDGLQGVGECVPVQYVTGETSDTAETTLKGLAAEALGGDCARPRQLLESLESRLAPTDGFPYGQPAARAALEMGLYDLICRRFGADWWSYFGGSVPQIETDVTLPMVDDTCARAVAFAEQGFRRFKVKIGRPDPDDDLRVLLDVARVAPDAVFRLDANQGYTPATALAFVRTALRMGLAIELLEQPVHREDLEGLAEVAAKSPVPVFADEAVLTAADALRVVRLGHIAGINVKLMKSGVQGAQDIISVSRAAGLSLMMGCMLETPRGIGFALSLAAGTGAFSVYDLDSHMMLAEADPEPYFHQAGPHLTLSR